MQDSAIVTNDVQHKITLIDLFKISFFFFIGNNFHVLILVVVSISPGDLVKTDIEGMLKSYQDTRSDLEVMVTMKNKGVPLPQIVIS